VPVVIVGWAARLIVGANVVCIGGASTGQGMAPQADIRDVARARRLRQTDCGPLALAVGRLSAQNAYALAHT
jgi:hypothetical protein